MGHIKRITKYVVNVFTYILFAILILTIYGKATITFTDKSYPNYFGYTLNNKGRTSGSRVMFTNKELPTVIILHKPHGRKELLDYQMKQVIDILRKEGLL